MSHRTQALTRESTSVMTTAFDAWVLSLPLPHRTSPCVLSRPLCAAMNGVRVRVRDSNRRGTPGPHRRHFASVRIVNGVGPAPRGRRGNRRFLTMETRVVDAKLFFFPIPIPGDCHSHGWHVAKGGTDVRVRGIMRKKKRKRETMSRIMRCIYERWVHCQDDHHIFTRLRKASLSSWQNGLCSSAIFYNILHFLLARMHFIEFRDTLFLHKNVS